MKWQPAPIIGGAYADNARPWSHQDTVNWLPVRTERPNGRSDWKLTPAPGLLAFSTLTNASTDSSDRIRGVRNVEGRLYVVCGQSLFRINGNGTATTIQENAIPGTQRVSMTHNQETGGNTLVITNGYGGWTYNTGTATFAEITDEGFPGFKVCDFLDQYIVGIDPTGRFAFHSELANAASYNTLDRYEAEAAPDRLVGQVVDHGQWWLFGERTTEIYTNTGAATGTFQRIPGSTIERGLAGTFAVAKLDNSVFWLGDDGVVYRANGYTPVRVSTHPIEQELSQCDLSLAFCMVYEDRGHKILYLTCPDGKTWGYDVATNEWHRRQSYARSNWRMESLVKWSGGWFGGDKLTNKLQRVDWGYQDEDGQPLIAERITGILHGNQNRVQVHGVELVLDTGRIPGPVRPPAEIVYPVEIYNALSAAYVGVAVSHNYLGRYGVEPYTFSLDAGTLPAGLSLASTGALTGTPTTAAAYAWRVKITDAIGQTDTLDQGVDVGTGIDGGAVFEVGYPGTWFSGPYDVLGDTAYYISATSPAGLLSATPQALPAEGSGALNRISCANGKVFMHRATTGCVSSDNGATWTACDNPIWDASWPRDVYWNGSAYYYGAVKSTNGITWSAIPNLPANSFVQNARASDGMITVQDNAGVFYTSTDSGASWTTRADFGTTYTPAIATDGDKFAAVSSGNVQYYSLDDLATAQNPVTQNSLCFSNFYSNGAWFVIKFQSGDGIVLAYGIGRAIDPAIWPDMFYTANFAFIQDGVELDSTMMAFDGAGTCVAWEIDAGNRHIYVSADNGVSFSLAGTLVAPAENIAYSGPTV